MGEWVKGEGGEGGYARPVLATSSLWHWFIHSHNTQTSITPYHTPYAILPIPINH